MVGFEFLKSLRLRPSAQICFPLCLKSFIKDGTQSTLNRLTPAPAKKGRLRQHCPIILVPGLLVVSSISRLIFLIMLTIMRLRWVQKGRLSVSSPEYTKKQFTKICPDKKIKVRSTVPYQPKRIDNAGPKYLALTVFFLSHCSQCSPLSYFNYQFLKVQKEHSAAYWDPDLSMGTGGTKICLTY